MNGTLADLFARQARAHSGRIAVQDQDTKFTYAELDERSDSLARRLRELGVRRGERVAVHGIRQASTIAGLLAIVKAGAAYVALDPRYPEERKRFILRDAGVRHVLTGEEPRPGPAARVTMTPEDIAYIAYTSGTTGTPKGVCVPHRAVSRLVIDPDYITITPDDVFLQFAPLAFDASTLEIWGPLLNGARLVVAPPDPSIRELTALVRGEGVTVLWLTAGLFQQVVEAGLADLTGLRYLLAGGDVLSPPHVARAVAALPRTSLINGYGPTENTTFTCCHRVSDPAGGAVPIGFPIRGTRVYLLDDDLEPVPDGQTGNLYAAGDGLGHGYLASPALTAMKFLPDPFSRQPGERMYHTGDLACRLPDGSLDYRGRTDQQVKVNGFRIETGEIEAALAGLETVAEAAVTAQRRASGTRLIAHVVGVSGAATSVLRIRRELGEILPSYAIPAVIRVMDAMPLTANGKVDRRTLGGFESPRRPEMAAAYREPERPLERAIAEMWGDHLGITGVGADDDFFELGGHSLMGVKIIAELLEAYGAEVSPVTFYLDPTPAGLAAAVGSAME